MQPLPDLCQYPHATGVLRAAEALAAYAPAYDAIAAHIEASTEDAR
jgi:hypothetical protein